MTESAPLRVEVVYALPERYWSVRLSLPDGATVADALALAAKEPGFSGTTVAPAGLAVFSRPVTTDTRLRDGDRVEILRPLLADPKQARRERAGR